MNLIKKTAENLGLPEEKIAHTIELLRDQNTVPFIARYRKEMTGNLNEDQIRQIRAEWQRLQNLEDRRQTILKSIAEQEKLTEHLRSQIYAADTLTVLEDIYLPYRPKRRTRALIAREKGLGPLAQLILQQKVTNESFRTLISPYINEQVPDQDSALAGAIDIAAELINENASIRQMVREKGLTYGILSSEKKPDGDDQRQVYSLYYQFTSALKYLKPHQILAINRGEKDKVLKVTVSIPERDWLIAIYNQYSPNAKSIFNQELKKAIEDCAKRLLLPTIERDIRRVLSDRAEAHAIDVFTRNLHGLLTQPPLVNQVVLAIDPGFRTGSKVAVVDPTGKLLDTATVYPHPPQNHKAQAYQIIEKLIRTHKVTLIAIGNGTASRETETFIAEITKTNPSVSYLITSEAGASVYSASKLAHNEFPNIDVSIRGAISIARRVQDPLAELVKIDAKSIGVGLYQHDINQSQLSQALDQVVESVVNAVGVDANTASAPLLMYVAGIGASLAEKIVRHRERQGPFKSRMDLQDIPGMGPKSFEQSAGFLRIRDGEIPLDATAIHPESYPIAMKVLKQVNTNHKPGSVGWQKVIRNYKDSMDLVKLADTLNTGLPTLEDILDELIRPGRDLRDDLPQPILRKDVLNMSDLSEGMQIKGTVRNVVDFGAFVDIGVKVDGLLHRSKIRQGTTLMIGDIIEIIILSIDHERERIALEMREQNDHN
jgi:protein Tex